MQRTKQQADGMLMTFGRTARQYAVRVGAVALALGTLAGCQSIDVNSSNAAQVRLFNASPDSNGFDFYDGSTAIAYNLGFGYKTSYVQVNPGKQVVTADAPNTRQVLASSSVTFLAQKNYTVLVGNVLANLQQTILQDQNFAAPSGQIAVRFVDQATRVGAVDVYLVPSGGKLMTTLPAVTNINLQTNTGYIDIPAGTYAIAVVPTGTVPVATTVTLYTGAQVSYSAGDAATVVLIDTQLTSTPGASAVVLDDYVPPGSTG